MNIEMGGPRRPTNPLKPPTGPLAHPPTTPANKQGGAKANAPAATDHSEVKSTAASGLTELLRPVADNLAESNNPSSKLMGEALQLAISGKDIKDVHGEIGGIVEQLKTKDFTPEQIKDLTKAGKLARVFDTVQGVMAASKLFDQAKELTSDPKKLKDPEFVSELISNGGGMAKGMLGVLELVKNSPVAGKIPGIMGSIADVSGLVGDFGRLTDGKASASDVLGTLAHATSLTANVMTMLAPATGGTSLAIAAGLKGVSLGLTGAQIVVDNWDKVKDVGSKVADKAAGLWNGALKGLGLKFEGLKDAFVPIGSFGPQPALCAGGLV
ncbi:hypothetical protein J7643_13815 [bacterium]|nr:hypothetical protein [bacterium]